MSLHGRKILLIGGSGFVSGTLAEMAVADGAEVWAVTRGQRPLVGGVTPIVVDRSDRTAFAEVLRQHERRDEMRAACLLRRDDLAHAFGLLLAGAILDDADGHAAEFRRLFTQLREKAADAPALLEAWNDKVDAGGHERAMVGGRCVNTTLRLRAFFRFVRSMTF